MAGCAKKAPKSARPLTNLAWQMVYGPHARASQYDTALHLYEKALRLQTARSYSEPIIMNNMAGIYFKKRENQKAIELLERSLALAPDYSKGRYDLATILIASGRWTTATKHIDYLLSKHGMHKDYLNLKGLILLHQKKYQEAIGYFRKALLTAPFFKDALMNLGIAYSLSGGYSKAETYLIHAYEVPPKTMLPLLALIENRFKAGDEQVARQYAGVLTSSYNAAAIKHQLDNLSQEHLAKFLTVESNCSLIKTRWTENLKKTLVANPNESNIPSK